MPTFSFTPIDVSAPVFDYVYISVTGMDAAGEAVGNYGYVDGDGDGDYRGFTATSPDGVAFDPPGSSNTDVVGITTSGEIYGDYTDYANRQFGFIESNGVFTKIDIPMSVNTIISGVNDNGVIFGSYADSASTVHGFIDNNGSYAAVNVAGAASTVVFGVNVAGEITGTYTDTSFRAHGFVDNNGVIATFDPSGSINTYVVAINAAGEVVGDYYDSSNTEHGFAYSNGVATSIDVPEALSTSVSGINDAGEIVGYYVGGDGNVHGFVDNSGSIATVDVPGAIDTYVSGVNNSGQIFGFYDDSSYTQHGFISGAFGGPSPSSFAPSDFNGDGFSDIALQNSDGSLAVWEMDGGAIIANGAAVLGNPGATVGLIGSGDFYGEGAAELLLQNTSSGQLAYWGIDQGASGPILDGSRTLALALNPGPSWRAVLTGDFNGDGLADIAFQNTNGAIAIWEMNGPNIIADGAAVVANPGTAWHAGASGDFYGTGQSELAFQNDDGSLAIWGFGASLSGPVLDNARTAALPSLLDPGSAWRLAGTGDFNGDDKSDFVFQNNDGSVAIWEMNGPNLLSPTSAAVVGDPGASWRLDQIGDFSGGGMSDLLFQNSQTGLIQIWTMDGLNIASQTTLTNNNPGTAWHPVG